MVNSQQATQEWTMTRSSHEREWLYWVDRDGRQIAAVSTGPDAEEVAAIIKAAPEMLKALERCRDVLDGIPLPNDQAVRDAAAEAWGEATEAIAGARRAS